ncbi:MAG: SUMF1/EgtB/PvdO family nonheme iron enzyme [Planctomycetes bacterium]|nr:SUMF1/EgtB/PvdO family nonheme iron enzyme [Planctomycetota bacterium]
MDDPGRWRRVRELLERALDHAVPERERFVREQGARDEALADEVLRLLRHDGELGTYLEPPSLLLSGASNEDPLADPRVGQVVGAWRLERNIGSGGMGTVYLAQRSDGGFERTAAVKVIRRGMDNEEMLSRLRRERQLLAQFDHPNVARLLDGGVTDNGAPYIVMEFVDGEPIDVYCDSRKLSIDARLRLFLKVCSAVQHAHQRLVIHRDLKPSNILVTRDGEPKLLDFGLAKMLEPDTANDVTRSGLRALTPAYASPEQVRGEAMTTTSDVYSLGVVLYRLLTGHLPYEFTSSFFADVGRAICEVEPKAPSDNVDDSGSAPREGSAKRLRRRLAGDLDTIVMKALRKEPARRYVSAEQFSEDIVRHLDGLPVIAQRDSLLYRASKFVRRHRTAVAGATTMTLALIAGVIVSSRLWVLASERYDEVLRLSDVHRVQQLAERADLLWPAVESKRADMQAWLGEAARVIERKPEHVARRNSLEVHAERSTEEAWELEVLGHLLDGIARLESDVPLVGSTKEMAAREQFAATVVDRTVGSADARAVWKEACAAIAQSPRYGGLEILPQLGLLPLGENAASGLWEFWHVQTGERPPHDERGGFGADERSGIVLVLLPGGAFEMGSPDGEADRQPEEGPVNTVELAPFFVSKFEVTQAQWQHITGLNPSAFTPTTEFKGVKLSLAHPVEAVSFADCGAWLGRASLTFPTEAQWEYAARGGTRTAWWTGDERASLEGAANLADAAAARAGQDWLEIRDWPELDDGFAFHAPVGSFRANPFGLYDVLGNVSEWCDDVFGNYRDPAESVDGRRTLGYSDAKPIRGGCMSHKASDLRCARRTFLTPEARAVQIGLRPVRPVWRPEAR